MAFERTRSIRFADVDFARVVYYPRFFDFCHEAFEDFFAEEVGCSYPKMLQERGVGFPSVHCDADYKTPLRFGDSVRIVLTCPKVSNRSVTTRYTLYRNGEAEPCAVLNVVSVAIEMGTFKGSTVPDDVKAAFGRHP